MGSRFLSGLGQGLQTFAQWQQNANTRQHQQSMEEQATQREIARDALQRTLIQAQIDALKNKPSTPITLPDGSVLVGPDGKVIYENAKDPTPRAPGEGYELRPTGPNGRLRYLPKPGVDGQAVDTGFDAPPPAPAIYGSDQGVVTIDRRSGSSQPVQAPSGGGQLQAPVNAGVADAYRLNNATLKSIDAAIEQLKSGGSGTGPLVGRLPSDLQGVLNPSGQALRNNVSDVGSLQIKNRTGATMSKQEAARMGFIPDVKDTEAVNLEKLTRLREYVAGENAAMLSQFPALRDGGAPATGGPPSGIKRHATTPADRWEELVREGMDKDEATAQVRREFRQ